MPEKFEKRLFCHDLTVNRGKVEQKWFDNKKRQPKDAQKKQKGGFEKRYKRTFTPSTQLMPSFKRK
jgi:hypothetical protein